MPATSTPRSCAWYFPTALTRVSTFFKSGLTSFKSLLTVPAQRDLWDVVLATIASKSILEDRCSNTCSQMPPSNCSRHEQKARRHSPRLLAGWLAIRLRRLSANSFLSSLAHFRGNRTWTANVLGISVRTLRNKINEYTAQGVAVARRKP